MKRFGLLFTVSICLALGCQNTGAKIRALQLELDKQLPVTSNYSDVLAYLDKKGIEHSRYRKAQNAEELVLLEAPGRIDGVLRKTKTTLISTSDIRLTFLFDDRGCLLSARVRESVKAP